MSGDLYYDNVSLLLHCDGTDGSTTFTDNSPTPKTVTAVGNAHVETDQSKWGGASGQFDGSGDYLRVDTPLITSAAWTVEAWVYKTSSTGYQSVFSQRVSNNGLSCGFEQSSNKLFFYSSATSNAVGSSGVALNTWAHVAWVYDGVNSIKGFVDGVQVLTDTGSPTVYASNSIIGASTTGLEFFSGYIDDIRVSVGVARYTANFTPPTEAFANDDGNSTTYLALTAYPPYLPGQIEAVMFGLQAFGLQSAPILAPTTSLALVAFPVELDGVLLPAAIEFRHAPLTPWVMPMTSPVYPPAVEVTLLPPPPGVSIRGLWSPADVIFGWAYNSGTDTISFPLASLFELTAGQADPVTGDWRAILLALTNTLWDAYIELDTTPQALVLEYSPGYMMTMGPMVNTVKAEYTATVYLTFPDKFIADEP